MTTRHDAVPAGPPVRLEVDATTGETITVPLTPDEIVEQDERNDEAADLLAQEQAKADQRTQDIQAVRTAAGSDPVIAALARLLGVTLT